MLAVEGTLSGHFMLATRMGTSLPQRIYRSRVDLVLRRSLFTQRRYLVLGR